MADHNTSGHPPAIEAVIAEMRMIARVAGQASVEGPRDFIARQSEAEALRAGRWADALEASLRPHPSPPPDRQAVFLGICGFTRHRAGCPQLSGPMNCTCGLAEAQEALIAALRPVEPPPDDSESDDYARRQSRRLLDALRPIIEGDDLRLATIRPFITAAVSHGMVLHATVTAPPSPDAPPQGIAALREAFDALLIAEVKAFGGIPEIAGRTALEQIALREAIAAVLAASPRPSPAGTKSTEALMADARRWHMAFNSAMRSITTGSAPEACDGPDCAICSFVLSVLTKWGRNPPVPLQTTDAGGGEANWPKNVTTRLYLLQKSLYALSDSLGSSVLAAHAQELSETIARIESTPRAEPSPTREAWRPIETHDGGDRKAWFWCVPKSADECPTDTSGNPICGTHAPYLHHGRYGNWGALSKAMHWQPEPDPPAPPVTERAE